MRGGRRSAVAGASSVDIVGVSGSRASWTPVRTEIGLRVRIRDGIDFRRPSGCRARFYSYVALAKWPVAPRRGCDRVVAAATESR